MSLRIMTYNVRGCRGLDNRVRLDRIAGILEECDADVIALQELDVGRARSQFVDQPKVLADHLEMDVLFYCCDGWREGQYGTAILSRLPLSLVRCANLPGLRAREPRGALWAEVTVGDARINVINTHLGLHPMERLQQVEALLGKDWVGHESFAKPAVVCGDFNFSPRDPLYRTVTQQLRDVQMVVETRRYAPTWLGMRTIDFILVNGELDVREARTHGPLRAWIASDHLPLIATLEVKKTAAAETAPRPIR